MINISLGSQPNGGKRENCLTSFIPDSGESPEWFDRPCVEYERNGEPGHRFMCECHVEEKDANGKIWITKVKVTSISLALYLLCHTVKTTHKNLFGPSCM